MKKLIALLSLLLIPAQAIAATLTAFSDVNSNTDYQDAIQWTVTQGITSGYDQTNTWGPDNCVNRAELLKMVIEYHYRIQKGTLFKESDLSIIKPVTLNDVFANEWYWPYLQHSVNENIIQGYSDNTFRPGNCVNRVEAMKVAAKTLLPGQSINNSTALYYDSKPIIDMESSAWYAPYARLMFTNRLVGTNHTQFADPNATNRAIYFYPSGSMTRKEVAKMLFEIDRKYGGETSIACTLEARSGLTIFLKNKNGEPITGAEVTAVSFPINTNNTLMPAIFDLEESDLEPGRYVGLWETQGTFQVNISKKGYQSYSENFTITGDQCHVHSQSKTIQLKSDTDTWQTMDIGYFSISLPPGWEYKETRGIDSFVGQFEGNGMYLTFDYGWYSNPLNLENDPTYTITYETVDDHQAKMVVENDTPGWVGMYIVTVEEPDTIIGTGKKALTIGGDNLSTTEKDLALQIFRTLQFDESETKCTPPPQPQYPEGVAVDPMWDIELTPSTICLSQGKPITYKIFQGLSPNFDRIEILVNGTVKASCEATQTIFLTSCSLVLDASEYIDGTDIAVKSRITFEDGTTETTSETIIHVL